MFLKFDILSSLQDHLTMLSNSDLSVFCNI
uniref:Uncharacterized protein n=1 Tax=Cryptosporidium parvum TaxID=5807 RepID=F0X557_CRYPV